VADKRCENGHYIDESWDLCPYCPSAPESEIPVVRPARARTEGPAPRPAPSPRPAPRSIPEPAPIRESFDPPADRTVVVRGPEGESQAQSHRYVVGWLVGLSGSVRGESFPVRMGRNVMGRDRRADITINDDQASTHHADLVFRPEEGRFILMDHNSTNGTYVNEAEIEPRRDLMMRDIVRIGAHRFLFIPLCSEGHLWDSEGELR
jgi:FHA domain-containing protein